MKETDLEKISREGYIFTSYGKERYLKNAVISAKTIRRYDSKRPIALYCTPEHLQKLKEWELEDTFQLTGTLKEEHRSIVGFKHNLHFYMPFDRNMFLDSDMIWCKNPDPLWYQLRPYGYTITGQESADVFFGAPKNIGVIMDILFLRRQRTLKNFGLNHLYRVQTGIIYASDVELTEKVDNLASSYLNNKDKTHFVSRTKEKGRTLESCEWSLGMAMSKLKLFVYPWFNGYESPQLDFIDGLTSYNEDLTEVKCKYYCNPFIQSLRGIKSQPLKKWLIRIFSVLPRAQDHMWVTPYVLHFGWGHQKSYFNQFIDMQWEKIVHHKI